MKNNIYEQVLKSINKIFSVCDGHSPVVYYDTEIIKYIMQDIKQNSTSNLKILYSLKANNNENVINFINEFSDGYELSSWNEYRQLVDIIKLEKFHDRIIFLNGTAYKDSQIIYAIKNGLIFNFSNLSQFERINQAILLNNFRFGIRLNVRNHESNQNTSRFGLTIDDLYKIKPYYKNIEALTLSSGLKDVESIDEEIDFIKSIINKFEFCNLKYINFGGGWDKVYFENDFKSVIDNICSEFENVSIIIEPGSLIVRNSGFCVTKVIDSFYVLGKKFVNVDISFFNSSSWFRPNIIAIKRKNINSDLDKEINIRVCGNTCYENDFIDIDEKALNVGDLCLLYPIGAYYRTTKRNLNSLDSIFEVIL